MLDDAVARLGVDAPGALAVVASAVAIYLAFLLMVRVLGQRVLSRLSTFDAVVVVMLGAVAGRAVLGDAPTLAAGVLGRGTPVDPRLLEGVRDAHLVPADLLREPGRG